LSTAFHPRLHGMLNSRSPGVLLLDYQAWLTMNAGG
jgi:hypothetical protein